MKTRKVITTTSIAMIVIAFLAFILFSFKSLKIIMTFLAYPRV